MSNQTNQPTPSTKELLAQIEKLTAENAKIKAANAPKQRALSVKVGKSGTISVYGLGRFPVSLYAGQWERLIKFAPDIAKFAQDNAQVIADVIAAKEANEQ